jgi:hypothetical protein
LPSFACCSLTCSLRSCKVHQISQQRHQTSFLAVLWAASPITSVKQLVLSDQVPQQLNSTAPAPEQHRSLSRLSASFMCS